MDKPKQKFKLSNILIIVAVLAVIAAVAVIYFGNQSTDNKEELQQMQNLVIAGSYQEAIDTANGILDSDPQNVEALSIRADVAQLLGNYQLAQDTNNKLYDITKNNYYRVHSININYGNTTGNTLNGGKVLETANETFYITYDSEGNGTERPVYTYNLWSKSDEGTESVFVDTGVEAFIGELQLWGNSVYFRTSQGIKRLDLYTKEISDFTVEGVTQVDEANYQTLKQFTIYNGEIYFILTTMENNYLSANTISKVNINGQALTEVVPSQETTAVGITEINSYIPFTNKVFYRTTNNTRYAIWSFMNGESTPLLESGELDPVLASNQTSLFCVSSPNERPVPQLYQVFMGEDSVIPIPILTANATYGINCDDNNVFYMSENGLSQYDIYYGNVTDLSNAIPPGAEGLNIYVTSKDIIIEQTGNFTGTYQNKFSALSRENLTEYRELFTGNASV